MNEKTNQSNGKEDKMRIGSSILQAIGKTSLVQICNVVPPDCGKVFVKLEWENPTGSMKDSMAQAMISQADEDYRLRS